MVYHSSFMRPETGGMHGSIDHAKNNTLKNKVIHKIYRGKYPEPRHPTESSRLPQPSISEICPDGKA
jgi:hypothetical protein